MREDYVFIWPTTQDKIRANSMYGKKHDYFLPTQNATLLQMKGTTMAPVTPKKYITYVFVATDETGKYKGIWQLIGTDDAKGSLEAQDELLKRWDGLANGDIIRVYKSPDGITMGETVQVRKRDMFTTHYTGDMPEWH